MVGGALGLLLVQQKQKRKTVIEENVWLFQNSANDHDGTAFTAELTRSTFPSSRHRHMVHIHWGIRE